jgi:hypothetical protein
VDVILIEQPNDKLIFERLKLSEFLIINNEEKFEIFVNIESETQIEGKKKRVLLLCFCAIFRLTEF